MQCSTNTSNIILASESPRRNDLLRQAGLSFSVVPSNFDESTVSMVDPQSYVKNLAKSKARDVSKKNPYSWVIGADTIVLINGNVLGKPESKQDARDMLRCLSGKSHIVITGFCICCDSQNKAFSDSISTEVLFKRLSKKEIEWYINTNEPYDKAGAYAIQGLGSSFVKAIHGSYTNVVGLPVCEIVDFLINESILELPNGGSSSLKKD